jgi:hypothetical protein
MVVVHEGLVDGCMNFGFFSEQSLCTTTASNC